MPYDSRPETIRHIREVQRKIAQVIQDLGVRGDRHDLSKLEAPEKEIFDEFSPKLKTSTYNSEEYKDFLQAMKIGLAHHYKVNDHHPEHFALGIHEMNLVQLLEMLCDWKAATMRHDDGDLETSIYLNAERFGYGEEIRTILLATARYFEWI